MAQPAETSHDIRMIGEVRDLSPRLREATLQSQALATPEGFPFGGNPQGRTQVRILLPVGYETDEERRYPVLYLLHGGGEDHTAWTTPGNRGRAEEITEAAPLIIVMPEGGIAGGYADWYNGGIYGAPQWATFHLQHLTSWIDSTFRTVPDRSGRAIAGLSMGGGGLRYAAQRPDLFSAAASFSGDIDILQPSSDWRGSGAFVANQIWGDPSTEELRWRAVNGPDLAGNLSNTAVALFSGNVGHPEGSFILAGAHRMHDELEARGIDHSFTMYDGMAHEWTTWNRALEEWLPHLLRALGSAVRHPERFSFTTTADTYTAFGWTVSLTRSDAAFSTLEAISPTEYTVIAPGASNIEVIPPR